MPSRNIKRYDAPESFYHVYVRGVNKEDIFREDTDKQYFINLFNRHLARKQIITKTGYAYPHYLDQVELLSFCVMDNHVHLLFYQVEQGSLQKLLKSILTSYTTYFNRRHGRCGPLYESRYKASLITDDTYLLHISRYIHLNPRRWKRYKYSSVLYYKSGAEPDWLRSTRILSLFKNRNRYIEFLEEYENRKNELSKVRKQLRNEIEV